MIKSDIKILYTDLKSIFISTSKSIQKHYFLFGFALIVFFILFFIDPVIRDLFAHFHNSYFDILFQFGHWYGKVYITIISFILLYIYGILFRNDRIRELGRNICEAFIISGIIVTLIKSILGRWRPYTEHGSFNFYFFTFGPNDHLSLPSGDVAIAFAFSTIVAGCFKNKLWKVFWFGIATITAFGRIYHDQHWFTDVIMAGLISITIGRYINKEHKVYF